MVSRDDDEVVIDAQRAPAARVHDHDVTHHHEVAHHHRVDVHNVAPRPATRTGASRTSATFDRPDPDLYGEPVVRRFGRWVLRLVRDWTVEALVVYVGVTLGGAAWAWDWLNASPRGVGAVLGLSAIGLFAIGTVLRLSPDPAQREQHDRASQMPRLAWVYDPGSPTYRHPMPPQHDFGRGGYLYRVGIRNDGPTAAEDVRVRLIGALPGATGLPATLGRMHDVPYSPVPFRVNAYSTEYIDVVLIPEAMASRVVESLDLSVDAPVPHMHVCFADPVFPWMPMQDCRLRFAAEGSNVGRPITAALRVTRDGLQYTVGFESGPES